MKVKNLKKLSQMPDSTGKMPVLFIGHGNPMNAIETNNFTEGWSDCVKSFPIPSAVLCISAHWETGGILVTSMEKPKTIHDFGGFPEELYRVDYPAPGNPGLAQELQSLITGIKIGADEKWGLDHGCWSVLKHMYPDADVPVIQLSLNYH